MCTPLEIAVTLHPDFPVVSGDYRLSEDWALTLPTEMNRRMEGQHLVLWRPGFTAWMSLRKNCYGESIQERLQRFQSDTSPGAFDASVCTSDWPARYSYRLSENRQEGVVYALYGFALKEDGHLQVAIEVDREADLADAESLFNSLH